MLEHQAQSLGIALKPFENSATASGFIVVNTGEDPCPIQVTSNVITTDVVKVIIDNTSDKEFAEAGDKIKYTVKLINNSSVDIYGVKIVDTISPKTILVQDSIVPVPQSDETLETGVTVTSSGEVTVGSVPKGKAATLEYKVTVSEGATGDIINSGFATLKFRDYKGNEYSGSTDPSTAITSVAAAGLQIVQSADKTFVAENNEDVLYTLIIKNTGTIKIADITVTNAIPEGMSYKQNSTLKNEILPLTDENPADGIYIGDLNPAETYKLQFSLTASL
ncbi:hypothetical protein [Hydrogenoanaerobacterium sp.]|uniref:hypothetical protein n=1 Tax=Hydrogenoanaerobacterium sp. TaxID=2953763 RepID=UPI0028969D30|nr:hypothetical protein [Hydrogenoanaerobacterium sp.]